VTDHDPPIEPGRQPDPGPGLASTPEQPGQLATPATPAAMPVVPVATPAPVATPTAAAPAAPATAAAPVAQPGNGSHPLDIDQIASMVFERIGEKVEHRPDSPQGIPSVEQAVQLREKAPELYDLWLKIAQEKAATGNYVQRAPYEVPERLAQSGRPRALSAMIVVLAFCGYLAWLGGPGPYIGGLIAILDLLVMLGLFFGLRPDHLSEPGRSRKRRLARTGWATPGAAAPGVPGMPAPGTMPRRAACPLRIRTRPVGCSALGW